MLATTDPTSLYTASALLPLLKISALLATGYAVHRALSPPNPPPAPKTCIDNRTLFERAIRHVTFCSKVRRASCIIPLSVARVHAGFPPPASSQASLLFSSRAPRARPRRRGAVANFVCGGAGHV